jgi:hypothetical protein
MTKLSLDAVKYRLERKLTKIAQGTRTYPWFERAEVRDNAVVVYVTDKEKADAVLTRTYYGQPVDIEVVKPPPVKAKSKKDEEEE